MNMIINNKINLNKVFLFLSKFCLVCKLVIIMDIFTIKIIRHNFRLFRRTNMNNIVLFYLPIQSCSETKFFIYNKFTL